jgi:hypothetical protein
MDEIPMRRAWCEKFLLQSSIRRAAMFVRVTSLCFVLIGVQTVQAGPTEIPLKDLKNDNDKIIIRVEEGKVWKSEVEFVLKIAPKITWHKKLKAFSRTGFLGEIEVRDDIKEAKLTLPVDKLAHVELGKAAFANTTHWDYRISDLRSKGGCRIILSWEKD